MALQPFIGVTSEQTTGTSLKTIAKITAGTNHRVAIEQLSISFKGTSATDAPVLVQLARGTNSGTFNTAVTLAMGRPNNPETLQVAMHEDPTVEPGVGAILARSEVHPNGGSKVWAWPAHKPLEIPGAGVLLVQVTAGANTTCVVQVNGEE